MKFHEYGRENEKTILLLPGTFCNTRVNFGRVIPLLAETFHVIGVDYDGFDGMGTEFSSMVKVTAKIERYIKKKYNGKLFAAYGSSLGGSFVGLLVQRGMIHIEHGFIGSSDLDQSGRFSAFLQTELVASMFYRTLKSGNVPAILKNLIKKKMGDEVTEKFMDFIGELSAANKITSRLSMERMFYSDLTTPLNDKIDVEGTTIHVFYALQMGEKYRRRYLQHFENADIIEQDYGHEELLFFYPEKWAEEIRRCTGMENKS